MISVNRIPKVFRLSKKGRLLVSVYCRTNCFAENNVNNNKLCFPKEAPVVTFEL
jgi:hypothetical protein